MPHLHTIEYLVRRDHVVVDVRGDWDDFADANGLPDLRGALVVGRPLEDFLEGAETMKIYGRLMELVLERGTSVRFSYRCDSPDRRRFMEMELEPMEPDSVRFRSRVLREEPRAEEPILDPDIPRSGELVNVCSWCKRFRAADGSWLEVEEFVQLSDLMSRERFPRLSHGICPACVARMEHLGAVGS